MPCIKYVLFSPFSVSLMIYLCHSSVDPTFVAWFYARASCGMALLIMVLWHQWNQMRELLCSILKNWRYISASRAHMRINHVLIYFACNECRSNLSICLQCAEDISHKHILPFLSTIVFVDCPSGTWLRSPFFWLSLTEWKGKSCSSYWCSWAFSA